MTLTLTELVTVSGNPASMWTRDGTSDLSVVHATFGTDEYHLARRALRGWAIDLGGHVGTIAAALLTDYPDLRVIVVEPLPDNLDMIRQNLAPFGDRAVIVEGAAGDGERVDVGQEFGGIADLPESYRETNRFIGRDVSISIRDPLSVAAVVNVPVVTLAGLMKTYGISEVALVKTDSESGEYPFFSDPKANAKVRIIVGELHDSWTSGKRITDLLAKTHEMVRIDPEPPDGVTGIFEAQRRT